MRLFVAIDINDDIKEKLSVLQKSISQQCMLKRFDVKWVSPEQMHLTLKFFDKVKNAQSLEIPSTIQEIETASSLTYVVNSNSYGMPVGW